VQVAKIASAALTKVLLVPDLNSLEGRILMLVIAESIISSILRFDTKQPIA